RPSGWIAALLLVGACSSDDPSTLVRQVIGPDGGQVSSHDEVLSILFLPGALEEDVEIQIMPSETPPPSLDGLQYRVKPDIPVAVPIQVTYRGTLPTGPSLSAAVGAIHVLDYLSGRGSWVPLEHAELNPVFGLVAGIDTEIALYYGLIGVPPGVDTEGDTMDVTGTGTDTGTTTGSTTLDDGTSGESTSDGDDGTASSGTSEPETEESSDSGPATIYSHADHIASIWATTCLGISCHSAGRFLPDLETDAYDAFMNTAPAGGSLPFITPGDPNASYVMHKLNGTHLTPEPYGCGCGTGVRMPMGMEPLPLDVRQMIAEWIRQGALP